MKALVRKSDLKEALDVTQRVSTKSVSLPILQNVLLDAGKGRILMRATDLQMAATYGFLATTQEEGRVVFSGALLSSLLAAAPEEDVSLASRGEKLLVNVGTHEAELKTLDEAEFPIIPSLEGTEPSFQLDTAGLCRGLTQVVGMAGQSQTRPEISGVLFVFDGKSAKVVATDSFRLAEHSFQLENEAAGEHRFILPAKTAREVVAILGDRPGKTTLSVSSTQAVFEYDGQDAASRVRVEIVSRLVVGEYPRYEDIIPASCASRSILGKSELVNHLKAAGVFAGKNQAVRVSVDPGGNEVAVSSESAELGSHRSRLAADVSGAPVKTSFNWRFLTDGLAQVRGEKVEFCLNGEDGAALVKPAEPEGYLYVVMPVKA